MKNSNLQMRFKNVSVVIVDTLQSEFLITSDLVFKNLTYQIKKPILSLVTI